MRSRRLQKLWWITFLITCALIFSRLETLADRKVATPQSRTPEAGGSNPTPFTGETLELPGQSVAPGNITLIISLALPQDFQLNPEAPCRVAVSSTAGKVLSFNREPAQTLSPVEFPLTIPARADPGETRLQIILTLNYCQTGSVGLCYFKEARLILPVTVAPGKANRQLAASYRVGP
jgi:hypothetical protein